MTTEDISNLIGAGAVPTRQALLAAIRASSMPMILSDPHQPDDPIVFVNDAFVRLSGYPETEIVGRNCRFLQGPDTDRAAVARLRDAVAARQSVTVELLNYRKDGVRFVNELRIAPIFDEDGELTHFFGCQTDVTTFTAAREELAQSDARYRTLFDAIDEGFCVIELVDGPEGSLSDYVHIETNAAFAANAGLDDAVGRSARELLGDEADGWIQLYRQVLVSGDPQRLHRELITTDRHLDLYAFRAGPLSERRVGVLFKDVTDRIRAERSLRELTATLEQQVEMRTRDLLASRDELRQAQKMEAIGRLTGGIAHDFNNLLTVIRSAAELLNKDDLSEDRRKRYARAVLDTADRAAKLTGQLLAFARRQPLTPEGFDASERIESLMQIIDEIVGSDVSVSFDPHHEPLPLQTDAAQFEAALVNLAANARDAMTEGGRLHFKVRPLAKLPAVRGHPAVDAPHVEVTIADTGSGIPDHLLERVFEPFFTTKELGKGTGLGLSQVYGFVKQSGGQMDVTSSPAGTSFTIYLPQALTPSRKAAGCLEASAETGRFAGDVGDKTQDGVGSALRVLAVEDDPALGPLAIELLRDIGMHPTLVTDATSALAELDDDSAAFDILFTDVMMPGMSGIDLAREVRRRHPNLSILLTSGYSDALAAGEAEGFPLLKKPYSADSLRLALTQASLPQPIDT